MLNTNKTPIEWLDTPYFKGVSFLQVVENKPISLYEMQYLTATKNIRFNDPKNAKKNSKNSRN